MCCRTRDKHVDDFSTLKAIVTYMKLHSVSALTKNKKHTSAT